VNLAMRRLDRRDLAFMRGAVLPNGQGTARHHQSRENDAALHAIMEQFAMYPSRVRASTRMTAHVAALTTDP
jgi:hypothetical protein